MTQNNATQSEVLQPLAYFTRPHERENCELQVTIYPWGAAAAVVDYEVGDVVEELELDWGETI